MQKSEVWLCNTKRQIAKSEIWDINCGIRQYFFVGNWIWSDYTLMDKKGACFYCHEIIIFGLCFAELF